MTDVSVTDEHRNKRSRGLKLAAMTSLVSKGANIVLLLIAVPLAMDALGKETYGVYATIAPLIAFVILSELGIGPGLTNILTKNLATGDLESDTRTFSTGFFLTAALSALGCLIVGLLVTLLPVAAIFGEAYAGYGDAIRQSVYLGLAIVFIKMVTSLAERARAASQDTFINNLYGAMGNLIAGVTLIVGVSTFPTIWFLIVTVNGALALASLGNFIHLLIQRPHLVPRLSAWSNSTARFLFKDGLAFCATMSVAPLLKDLCLRLLLGRIGGPAVVAVFDLLERLIIAVYGFVVMFTLPLWPALNDAATRRDFEWINKARKRLYLIAAAYGVMFTLGLAVFGPWAMQIWSRGNVEVTRIVMLAFSLYVSVSIWQHVHHIFLAGLDAIRMVSVVVLAELPLFVVAAYLGYRMHALPGMFFALAAVGLAAAIIFPILAKRRMQQLENAPPLKPPLDEGPDILAPTSG